MGARKRFTAGGSFVAPHLPCEALGSIAGTSKRKQKARYVPGVCLWHKVPHQDPPNLQGAKPAGSLGL